MTATPEARAKSSRRRSTAAGDAEPGSDMPSASPTDAMVLAVNIPAQLPSVGHALRSIASSSASVIAPVASAPTASNTETMSIFTYVKGFQQFETSYTAAVALLIIVGLSVVVSLALRRVELSR